MDEDIEAERGDRAPKRAQRLGVKRLPLQLGRDHDARKSEIDGAALQFGGGFRRLERGYVGERDEAARIIFDRLPHAVVDQPTGGKIGLVEARAAGEHARIDAGAVHHPYMCVKIGEQRVEQIIWVAVGVEPHRDGAALALEQFRWRVVLLEVDDHVGRPSIFLWLRRALTAAVRGRIGAPATDRRAAEPPRCRSPRTCRHRFAETAPRPRSWRSRT